MVAFETVGDNDFRSIFQSMREEHDELQERREAERMLRILDELEHRKLESQTHAQDERPPSQQSAYGGRRGRVEHLRISSRGDIEDDDVATGSAGDKKGGLGGQGRKLGADRGKVHTLDDLPRESEFDLLFGSDPLPPPEPAIKVETGIRLHDGKPVHRAVFPGWSAGPGLDDMQVFWSGMSFESIMFLVMVLSLFLFLAFRIYRIISRRNQQRRAREQHQARINEQINQQVRLQVREQVQAHLLAMGAQLPSGPGTAPHPWPPGFEYAAAPDYTKAHFGGHVPFVIPVGAAYHNQTHAPQAQAQTQARA